MKFIIEYMPYVLLKLGLFLFHKIKIIKLSLLNFSDITPNI